MDAGDDQVSAAVEWTEPGAMAAIRAFFGRPQRVLRGEIVADRAGLAVHASGVHGALHRWAWHDVADLGLESAVASYLLVEAGTRPRRFELVADRHPMPRQQASDLIARLTALATANGWTRGAADADQGPRAQRLAANTAAFVRRFPDAYVVRTAAATSNASRVTMVAGLAFASATRFGHLVADADGLRMFQGANDLEWEKPWSEVMGMQLSEDERALKFEALGWEVPKYYAPCEPNGDVLLPFAVGDVLAQLRAKRPATGVR